MQIGLVWWACYFGHSSWRWLVVKAQGDDFKFKSRKNFIQIYVIKLRAINLLPSCLFKPVYIFTQSTSRDYFVGNLQYSTGLTTAISYHRPIIHLNWSAANHGTGWDEKANLPNIQCRLDQVSREHSEPVYIQWTTSVNVLNVFSWCYTRSISYLLIEYCGKMPLNATWKINGLRHIKPNPVLHFWKCNGEQSVDYLKKKSM